MIILDVVNPGGVLILGGVVLIGALAAAGIMVLIILFIVRHIRKSNVKADDAAKKEE